jgi:hypothetical protein
MNKIETTNDLNFLFEKSLITKVSVSDDQEQVKFHILDMTAFLNPINLTNHSSTINTSIIEIIVDLDKELINYTNDEWFSIVKSLDLNSFKITSFDNDAIKKDFINTNRYGAPTIMLISKENLKKYNITTDMTIVNWDSNDIIVYRTNEYDTPGFAFVCNSTKYNIMKISDAERNFAKIEFI